MKYYLVTMEGYMTTSFGGSEVLKHIPSGVASMQPLMDTTAPSQSMLDAGVISMHPGLSNTFWWTLLLVDENFVMNYSFSNSHMGVIPVIGVLGESLAVPGWTYPDSTQVSFVSSGVTLESQIRGLTLDYASYLSVRNHVVGYKAAYNSVDQSSYRLVSHDLAAAPTRILTGQASQLYTPPTVVYVPPPEAPPVIVASPTPETVAAGDVAIMVSALSSQVNELRELLLLRTPDVGITARLQEMQQSQEWVKSATTTLNNNIIASATETISKVESNAPVSAQRRYIEMAAFAGLVSVLM